MIHNIINGLGVTEVLNPEITAFSERSGSSTTSRSATTTTADARYAIALPNGQVAMNIDKDTYDRLSAYVAQYNEAYDLAKAYNYGLPDWKDFSDGNGQTVIDTMKAMIAYAQRSQAEQQAAQKAAAESAAAANALEPEYLELCKIANEYGIINLPTFTQYQKLSVSDRNILKNDYLRIAIASYGLVDIPGWSDFLKLSDSERDGISMVVSAKQRKTTTPPEVVLPDNMPTVQPQEEKRSGILIPALIFAVGAIAAIALVKTSNKKRR